ncbi:uncharacterized protein F5891DRAFT_964263 [Suillus fuscotomentosus]|uniref:Uncharacterized protein n=1 Tax=Suillus fuscotomentosus TaxID=1912939 RepID=A0AAD4DRS2_9AGAM|nr:uncharacterized protein F5891DRAFT_964263 [Suillus fuscotomentosus]KAG1891669.1 hypothetical protein F5891DRAFT_964263 [Suillus fuscotomentosus]
MACGHGYPTSQFIQDHELKFSCLNDCLSLYERAAYNAGNNQGPFFNTRVWGQPSVHFGVQSSRDRSTSYPTTHDKFTPLFSSELQDKWVQFLGPMACQDPGIKTELRLPWVQAKDWILQQKLHCFSSGLTPFQFCNNLVALGICNPPTAEEMGSWIGGNRRLGAFQGLKILGFNIDARGPKFGQTAFQSFHAHLEQHLHPSDKLDLTFSTIFSEHLLCKIFRYAGMFQKTDKTSLISLAENVSCSDWRSGDNINDESGQLFPIPFGQNREVLDQLVAASD